MTLPQAQVMVYDVYLAAYAVTKMGDPNPPDPPQTPVTPDDWNMYWGSVALGAFDAANGGPPVTPAVFFAALLPLLANDPNANPTP